ncbi:hypothetical protein ACFY9N_05760 [Microbacterium sp. NPDC008134]|uniref:hypothetical protein n=1 Tax=Microbacterium sp. NPDC008134 TaxID=3364183 RepID=UPI0036F0BE4D
MTEPLLKQSSALIVMAVLGALVLAGCTPASEPHPSPIAASQPVETEKPGPAEEIQVGDELTAEQAQELNDSNDLTVAYPVGDKFIAVRWGQPIPEPVLQEVNAQVNAGVGASHGTGTGAAMDQEQANLQAQLQAESDKLGGITVTAVQCALSFSTSINSFAPAWAVSEPGPVGTYDSQAEATSAAQAWADGQPGKRIFVVLNNLGC